MTKEQETMELCNYTELYYKEVIRAVFEGVTFKNICFNLCIFYDVEFKDCTFDTCIFEDGWLSLVSFDTACTFKNVYFRKTNFFTMDEYTNKKLLAFQEASSGGIHKSKNNDIKIPKDVATREKSYFTKKDCIVFDGARYN